MSRILKAYLVLFLLLILSRVSFTVGDTIVELPDFIRSMITFAFVVLTFYIAWRLSRAILRKLLWRIRRKLILSYIFVGLIPLVLLILLFVLGSWIFIGQTASELINSSFDGYVLHVEKEGEKLLHLSEFLGPEAANERWFSELAPENQVWLRYAEVRLIADKQNVALRGSPPEEFPAWLQNREFSGVIVRDSRLWLTSVHRDKEPERALQIHVPVTGEILDLIHRKTGVDIRYYLAHTDGRNLRIDDAMKVATSDSKTLWPRWWDLPIFWISLPDQIYWESGEEVLQEESLMEEMQKDPEALEEIVQEPGKRTQVGAFVVGTNLSRMFNHIFSRSITLQRVVYYVMASVVIIFLVIEFLSMVFGILLARSMTASVHNLFEGTERIKSGDLNYRIKVTAQDQLGELAVSFNRMTESIQDLLKVRAEKERLSESLKIARQMQEKLLPREILSTGTIEISTLNIPAQEVCGDYYDIIRTNPEELNVIIADVSGKGPSAALYMAEVKGVMMSLSRDTIVPREALLRANEILGPTLDSKNFITMTYATVNEDTRTLQLSRAGHNPLLHYCSQSGAIEIVQPKGIGLGLAKNGIFEGTLEQIERKLHTGDLLVFYTDGLTEAMDQNLELYGLSRLSSIIAANKESSAEQVKNAIMLDLQNFLNRGLPQDDITLVLLKIK